MAGSSFTGVSRSRSLDEAVKDALLKVSKYHGGLPGADILINAKLQSISFKKGGFAGLDVLEVEFILD